MPGCAGRSVIEALAQIKAWVAMHGGALALPVFTTRTALIAGAVTGGENDGQKRRQA